MQRINNIEWVGDAETGFLKLLDQTVLPTETRYLDCRSVDDVWHAIKRLSVRGAPAIGIAAAYGCVIGTQGSQNPQEFAKQLAATCDYLATSRPTAVNLFWALDRMKAVTPATREALLAAARLIHEDDARMCQLMGEHALELIRRHAPSNSANIAGTATPAGVLTHCNAGALATGGIGTATAPFYLAKDQGVPLVVYADETRPLLQGARLTAYELGEAGIDVILICDDMAAQVMREGRIHMVITGADRIAANGDAANKIGTYNLAILARYHGIPFYIAAPSTTFDLSLPTGDLIPIEERASEEITEGFGKRTAPANARTYSPAFDVTPASLITAIVTERGIIDPVNTPNIRQMINP